MATIALANNAVATLAYFRTFSGITSSTLDDEVATMYLNAASQAVEKYIGYEFHRQTVTDEKHKGTGDYLIPLRRFPVISVTTVTYNGTNLSASDYAVDTDAGNVRLESPQWSGVYQTPAYAYRKRHGDEERLFEIDYESGWVTQAQSNESGGTYENDAITLPNDILLAALQFATMMGLNHGLAAAGIPVAERLGDAEKEYAASLRRGAGATAMSMAQGMPDWIATKLLPYKRVRVA